MKATDRVIFTMFGDVYDIESGGKNVENVEIELVGSKNKFKAMLVASMLDNEDLLSEISEAVNKAKDLRNLMN